MISGINEILSENSALVTLIGEDKIFPVAVPENTDLPYLAVSLARINVDEIKGNASGFYYGLVNVNVHAEDYDQLEEVSEAVIDALDNVQSVTDTGHTFANISVSNAFDRPELFTNTPRQTYTRSVQFNAIVKR